MTELDTLAHKLRTMAGDDGYWVTGPISAIVLREAADAIESLRDRLQESECEVIQGDNGPKCSRCGKELPEDPYSDYEGNFCPTCGARIRKAVKR